MSERFNQYKLIDTDKIDYQWVIFDNEMPDDVLRDLMAPVEAAGIDRERGVVGFYSTTRYSYELLDKVRNWEKTYAGPLRAEIEKQNAAESRARFEQYYTSLGLNDDENTGSQINTGVCL